MSAFAPSRDVRGCVDQGSAEDAEDDAAARSRFLARSVTFGLARRALPWHAASTGFPTRIWGCKEPEIACRVASGRAMGPSGGGSAPSIWEMSANSSARDQAAALLEARLATKQLAAGHDSGTL